VQKLPREHVQLLQNRFYVASTRSAHQVHCLVL